MKALSSLLCLSLLLLLGCKGTQKTVSDASIPEVTIEERNLDTMVVTAPKPTQLKSVEDFQLPPYAPSYTLDNDLLHTILDLRFDWEKEHVLGKATLTLKPWFYPVDQVTLDAKGFDFHRISHMGKTELLK
ncbi:MAG: hypothetical protein AAF985_19195 [Bacteroidota bacterium]